MACCNRLPIIVGLAICVITAGSTTSVGQTSAGPQTFKYQTQIPPGIGVPIRSKRASAPCASSMAFLTKPPSRKSTTISISSRLGCVSYRAAGRFH